MDSEVAQSICCELLSKQTHSETKILCTFSDLGAGATTRSQNSRTILVVGFKLKH